MDDLDILDIEFDGPDEIFNIIEDDDVPLLDIVPVDVSDEDDVKDPSEASCQGRDSGHDEEKEEDSR